MSIKLSPPKIKTTEHAAHKSTTMPPLMLRPPQFTVKRLSKNTTDQRDTTRAYKQLVQIQKNKPSPAFQMEFEQWVQKKQPEFNHQPFKMEPGKPIPPVIMRLFMVYLKSFGINLESPYLKPEQEIKNTITPRMS